MKLSEKMISLRKTHSMSQEELAEQLGVSRQAISRWENASAKPDAEHIVQISKLFDVTTDYLLHDDYDSDNDVPPVKESNEILRANLTKIAIMAQAAFLNVAMQPFEDTGSQTANTILMAFKFVPLLAASIWMAHNLRYENNPVQYKKNTRIELVYCLVQTAIALLGHYSKQYFIGTILLITVACVYVIYINPKYMHRQLTKKKNEK